MTEMETVESASLVPMLSENEAREITAKIYTHLDQAWPLIAVAYQGQAWKAMGYTCWDDYLRVEFGGIQFRLPRAERQEVVQALRESGMSQQAIATVTGANQATVSRDLAGHANASPESVTGLDGKTYPATVVQVEAAADPEEETPARTRRRPLPEVARDAGPLLRKSVEKIERILDDEAYTRNADSVYTALHADLVYAWQSIQNCLERLEEHSS